MSFGTCTRCFGAEVEQKRVNSQAGLSSFFAKYVLRHRETLAVVPKGEKTSPDIPPVQETSLLLCGTGDKDMWESRALWSFDLPAQPVTKRQHVCPERSSALKESGDSKCNSSGDKQSLKKVDWTVNLAEAGPEDVKPLDTVFTERDHGKALEFCRSSTF